MSSQQTLDKAESTKNENDVLAKIKSAEELIPIIDELKKQGKSVVHCHGVFDIVHLGHIRHFNMAKKEGDVLLATITTDRYVRRGPGRPYFNQALRAETLASLAVVDYVCIIDAHTATDFIRKVKPSVYVKGSDYKAKDKDVTGKIFEEEDAIQSVGGRLAFTDDITFSSSQIINNYIDVFPPRTRKYLKAIGQRYPIDKIIRKIDDLKKMKVLVIGDAIIDEYHYCTPMGKSSKEHLIVNRYVSQERFAGGVLATANHLAGICGDVELVTVLGQEETYQEFIQSKLKDNVEPTFFYRNDAQTILKKRYVSTNASRKIFEICHIKDEDIEQSIEKKIIKHLDRVLDNYDLIVVNDFGHGLMTKNIRDFVCGHAKNVALNVQTNSANAGFNLVTKYSKANYVCIDEMELRFAAHDKFSDIRALTKNVYNEIKCEHIIATRGPLGSIAYSKNDGYHETPALASSVVDAIGAGDAFFAYVGPCFNAQIPPDLVSFIGNAVGSLAVQIVGNRESVDVTNLKKFITRLLK